MAHLWSFLYVIQLISIHCNALKIFEDSLNNTTEYRLFYHRTADFGPQPPTYNVSGRLQLMRPSFGCNIAQYTSGNNAGSISYDQIYQNDIVLILRGNCTFSKKVHNAELLGAIGVIVGDYNTSTDEWIVMSRDPTQTKLDVTIPAVFVPHNTYQWIHTLISSYVASPDLFFNALEDMDMIHNSDGVYAILDSDGEYVAPNSTFWLAAFGIVIIIIPTLWCFIVCVALVRRKIVRYVQRSRRRKHLNQIPVILYREIAPKLITSDATSIKQMRLSVSNEAVDGDKYMNLVNIEQDHATEEMMNDEEDDVHDKCVHMKHEIDAAGSLSTNFKSMSRFLLDQFRGKKEYTHPHNDSCAICLDDFRLNDELRLLPCNHGFHKQCVDPWLTKSSELCPMCKQSIFMSHEDNNVSNGCSISKVCCIRNRNGNDGNDRRRENNEGNAASVMNDGNDNNEDGIIVLATDQDELVSIDSNHSQSDQEDNVQLEQE